MRRLLILGFLCATLPLAAADNGGKRFLKLKDDTDLYVGEGVAVTQELGGDGLKALAAARERARANLAAAIRVRIVSETKATEKSGPDGSTETVESKSASLADVVLENVRYEDFPGLPADGQVSSLAIVSKADYRRQLAGKAVRVYQTESGLRLGAFGLWTDSLDHIKNAGNGSPPSGMIGSGSGNLGSSSSQNTPGYALEFFWHRWVLGLHFYQVDSPLYVWDPSQGKFSGHSATLGYHGFQLGYDWELLDSKLQPFVPLRLIVAHSDWEQYSAIGYGAQGGLGLRYWPTDGFSFELSGRWQQGFNSVTYQQNGKTLIYGNTNGDQVTPEFSITGAQILGAINWNGF
jgi:hypothetical protein